MSPDKNAQVNAQQVHTNKNDKNEEEENPTPAAGSHQAFVDWFCGRFQEEAGIAYSFQGGKDGSAVKSLLEAYSPTQIKDMTDAMFADAWGRANASPHILWNQRNKWAAAVAPRQSLPDPSAVRDLQLSLDILDGKVAMPDG